MDVWNLTVREYIEINRLAREQKLTLFEELEKLWDVKIGEVEGEIKDVNNPLAVKMLDSHAIAGISNLLEIIDNSLKRIKDGRSILEILYDFVKIGGYLDSFLEEESGENLFAVSNIQKFFELVKKYEKDNPDSNIYEYVDYLNYCIEVGESPVVDQSQLEDFDGVNILTVHGSKGLEFPVVFLVNLVSQRFPSQNRSDAIPIPEELIKETLGENFSESNSHMQEERRLFYVGATRAMEKLYLTAAKYYGDGKSSKKPSVFLNEILDRDVGEEFVGLVKEGGMKIASMDLETYESIVPKDVKLDVIKKFSYSQLHTYEDCPRKYEYSYVLRVPQKPNSTLSFGTTIHNTLRDLYTALKRSKEGLEGVSNPPTLKDFLSYYEKNWVSSGYESSKQESLKKKEGEEMLKKYYEKMYSEDQSPLRLEESFSVHFGESVFAGKIDRIDVVGDNGEVCIVDYKTGKVKSEANIKKDLQLPLYAVFAQEKLGLNVVGAKYLFVESMEEIEVDISQKRKDLAKEKLLEAIDNIRERKFTATPGFVCNFCDYNSVCEFAEI